MSKHFDILAAALTLGLAGTPALATGVTKTWVSSTTGNDSGTCAFTSPCKTFAYAITQTTAGGEIDVKDGGSYGSVTITKAVSIVSEGVLAAVSVPSGGVGVTVNAGSSDMVTLQGLMLDGHGVGQNGILFNSGKSLTVQECQVRNLVNTAIGAVVQTTSQIEILDTTVANSGNGVVIQPSSSGFITVSASMERVQALNNTNFGIYIDGANARSALTPYDLIATIDDSIASGSGNEGVRVESKDSAMFTNVSLSNSRIVRNGIGVSVINNDAHLFVSRTLFIGNTSQYPSGTSGNLVSQGNNTIFQSGAGSAPNFPSVVSNTY